MGLRELSGPRRGIHQRKLRRSMAETGWASIRQSVGRSRWRYPLVARTWHNSSTRGDLIYKKWELGNRLDIQDSSSRLHLGMVPRFPDCSILLFRRSVALA